MIRFSPLLSSAFLAATLTVSIAACSEPSAKKNTTAQSEQSADMATITGTLFYPQRIALRPGLTMTVTLSDISIADRAAPVLAEVTTTLGNEQVPLPFTLSVDPIKLAPNGRYAVRGTLKNPNGDLIWTTDTVYPVTAGKSAQDVGGLKLVMAER
ncbi:MAG: YbaY family lipoprotein [Alphaproteobacteria bacterium]